MTDPAIEAAEARLLDAMAEWAETLKRLEQQHNRAAISAMIAAAKPNTDAREDG